MLVFIAYKLLSFKLKQFKEVKSIFRYKNNFCDGKNDGLKDLVRNGDGGNFGNVNFRIFLLFF